MKSCKWGVYSKLVRSTECLDRLQVPQKHVLHHYHHCSLSHTGGAGRTPISITGHSDWSCNCAPWAVTISRQSDQRKELIHAYPK